MTSRVGGRSSVVASRRHSPGRTGRGRSVDPKLIYQLLRDRFGPAGWWPARTAFEVCVGAILTQSTSWRNVEKALGSLRARGRLSFKGLFRVPEARLAGWIRPLGFSV